MTTRRNFIGVGGGLVGAAAGWPLTGFAQEFPNRPLIMVVPWPAGGPADVIGRLFSQKVGPRVKQPIVVENRAGATGTIGLSFAAKATPDGYTYALASIDSHAINPHYFNRLPYRPIEDFTPIGGFCQIPLAICVNSQRPFGNINDFVQAARAQPQKLTYSSWGNGSLSHVTMALFARQAGIELTHVPYQGAAPALNGVMGGEVDAMVMSMGMFEASVPGKRLRFLGTTSSKRIAPDLVTLAEQGHPVDVSNWFGIVASGRPPQGVVERMSAELAAAVGQPDTLETLRAQSMLPLPARAPEFQDLMAREYDRWGRVLKDLGIKQST